MRDELTDRFGAIPASVENLLRVAYLRTLAAAVYVTDIKQTQTGIELRVLPNAGYDPEAIGPFIAGYKGKMKLVAGAKPCFLYRFPSAGPAVVSPAIKPLDISLGICDSMKALVAHEI